MNKTILIIEDELKITFLLRDYLKTEGIVASIEILERGLKENGFKDTGKEKITLEIQSVKFFKQFVILKFL